MDDPYAKPGVRSRPATTRRSLSTNAALVQSIIVLTLSVVAAGLISKCTDRGLLGICGPYGDGMWVGIQAALLLGGLVAAVVVFVWRRGR
jgi:hypothetical protein